MKKNAHSLITLGDSLSQGFQSGAAYDPASSYPSLIASCLNQSEPFYQPTFYEQGGLPLNIEILLRGVEEKFGPLPDWDHTLEMSHFIFRTLKRIKKHWDNQQHIQPNKKPPMPYHNQSSWGLGLNDAWMLTDDVAAHFLKNHSPDRSAFSMLPTHPKYSTVRRVINPSGSNTDTHKSLFSNVEWFSENGGIENLIVFLGANNILGAIVELTLRFSENNDLYTMPYDRRYTVLRPEHFEQLYQQLAEKISRLNVKNVFVATIPYIHTAPAIRPMFVKEDHAVYADYYTQYWIRPGFFDPAIHPHLTRSQIIQIELYIDDYNRIINKVAAHKGWHVVPLNRMVTSLHMVHRNIERNPIFPEELRKAALRNASFKNLLNRHDQLILNTEYLGVNAENGLINRGGIFSLDGLHPTTTAYAMIAHLFMDSMKKAGVTFERELDWDTVLKRDTLLTQPPQLLRQMETVMNILSSGYKTIFTKLTNNVLQELLQLFSWGEDHVDIEE